MAFKRTATTELNHENWDIEEEPETSGVFKTAPSSVLASRHIRHATRRLRKVDGLVDERVRTNCFQNLALTSAPRILSNVAPPFFVPATSTDTSVAFKEKTSVDEKKIKASENENPFSSQSDNFEKNTSSGWNSKSVKPFSSLAFAFPAPSQTKPAVLNDQDHVKSFSFGPSKVSIITTGALAASTSTMTPAITAGISKNATVTLRKSLDDRNFSFDLSDKSTKAKPLFAQEKSSANNWTSPLKCSESLPVKTSFSSGLATEISESGNKLDSRHLLKPVPKEILKRLEAKSNVTGKSIHFLKRTYQLNVTMLDWINVLIQEDLTINIAEIIPSYIEELISLMDEEIVAQKEKNIGNDLNQHHAILNKMLEVFKLFEIGTKDSPSQHPRFSGNSNESLGAKGLSNKSFTGFFFCTEPRNRRLEKIIRKVS